MPITFTCECGEELTVEEQHAERAVLCPKCKTSRTVPDELRKKAGQRASGSSHSGKAPSLFADAIAALEQVVDKPSPATPADTPQLGERTLDDYSPETFEKKGKPEAAPQLEPPRLEDGKEELSGNEAASEVPLAELEPPELPVAETKPAAASPAAGTGKEKKASAEPASVESNLALQPAEGGDAAKASQDPSQAAVMPLPVASGRPEVVPRVIDAGKGPDPVPVAKADASPSAEVPPKSKPLPISRYEVIGDKVKFTCECGKRIVSPIRDRRETGKCPKCGSKLLIPRIGESPRRSARDKKKNEKEAKGKGRRWDTAGKKARRAPATIVSGDTFACPHCGKTPPGGSEATYCAFCGKPLAEAAQEDASETDKAASPVQPVPNSASARAAADGAAARIHAARPKGASPAEDAAKGPRAVTTGSAAAGLGARLGAGLADATLVLAALLLVGVVFKSLQGDTAFAWNPGAIAAGAIAILNEVFLVMGIGQTLGKSLVGITVIRADNLHLGPGRILLRCLFKLIAFPGTISVFFDPEHRALHDLVSGTFVIGRSHAARR